MFDYQDEDDDATPGVETSGQQFPVRHDQMVQANAGFGSPYNPASHPMAPLGRSLRGAPDGIGSYSRLYQMPTPGATRSGVLGTLLSGSPVVQSFRAVSGLGAAADGGGAAVTAPSALLVGFVAVALVATGVSGYYVGKAVAPSSSKESKYAWWGVAAALFGGPVGLGIESIVALGNK